MPPEAAAEIVGVLLAGGRARRMGGGDKCLRVLGGETLLARAIARARPQVDRLILNAEGDLSRFNDYGLAVVADPIPGFAGPLAGVLAGLDWAAAKAPGARHVATFATDAPFFPADLVARLAAAVAGGADLACAASAGRNHPVFALWPVGLRDDLRQAMTADGIRKVDVWTARYRLAEVDFPTEPVDPFFNANRPEDLATAADMLARMT
ncbi:MAG: molybdenum cofactor guanylyltransferase MobA [Alphaproteobacteria bacterium]|jgi:molybdopterin-guanine dinucleotide biosynthesis protein A|nr:molybdenum cofactor guanylyltransferase MobA [Alphaproteobacteria bacterium]